MTTFVTDKGKEIVEVTLEESSGSPTIFLDGIRVAFFSHTNRKMLLYDLENEEVERLEKKGVLINQKRRIETN